MTHLASIVEQHGPRVWQTTYRLLNHHADALDCYQETFLAAWQFAERDPITDWGSFLVRLATRRAIDRLRQRYRSRLRYQEIESVPEPTSRKDCPQQQAEAMELMDRVRQGLAELPDKQAEVFWLSCIEGMPHQLIGDRMQIPCAEVRVLLHRARTRLRALLGSACVAKGNNHE